VSTGKATRSERLAGDELAGEPAHVHVGLAPEGGPPRNPPASGGRGRSTLRTLPFPCLGLALALVARRREGVGLVPLPRSQLRWC